MYDGIVRVPLTLPQLIVKDSCRLNPRAGSHVHAFHFNVPGIDVERLSGILDQVVQSDGLLSLKVDIESEEEFGSIRQGAGASTVYRDSSWVHLRQSSAVPLHPAEPPQLRFDIHEIEGKIVLVTKAHHMALDGLAGKLAIASVAKLMSASKIPERDILADIQKQNDWNQNCIASNSHAVRLDGFAKLIETMPATSSDAINYPGIVKGDVVGLSLAETARFAKVASRRWASPFLIAVCIYANIICQMRNAQTVPIAVPFATRELVGLPDAYGNLTDYVVVHIVADTLSAALPVARHSLSESLRHFLPLYHVSRMIGLDRNALNPLLRFTASLQPGGTPSNNAFLAVEADFKASEVRHEILYPAALDTRTVTLEMQELGLVVGEVNGELRWLVGGRSDVINKEQSTAFANEIKNRIIEYMDASGT